MVSVSGTKYVASRRGPGSGRRLQAGDEKDGRLKALAGNVLDIFRRALIPLVVLAISLSLTVLAWRYVDQTVRAQEKVRFDETVQATQTAVEGRANAYVNALLGARGLLISSNSVSRSEWDRYVASLDSQERFPGFQALGYVERVSPDERKEFSREAVRDGLPPMEPDTDPGGEREVYFPVTYVAPQDQANRKLFSRDLYFEANDRAAMNQARDTGEATATGMDYVITSQAVVGDLSRHPGFFVYLPLYEGGEMPVSVAERRDAIEGFVVGAFSVDGLLSGVSAGQTNPTVDFEVYDGRSLDADRLFYDDDGTVRGGDSEQNEVFAGVRRIELGGRPWNLYFATLPEFEENFKEGLSAFVLASGLAVSFLLFGITWLLVQSRERAERASLATEAANRELEATNRELESFSYSVSHDLRAPLRSIDGFSQILLEDYADSLDEDGADYLGRVRAASQRMGNLIDDLLTLSRTARASLRRERVNLGEIAGGVASELRRSDPERDVEFVINGEVRASGDPRLLRVALENLLGNAWKFTARTPGTRIEFGSEWHDGRLAYFVRDNGAGFDMSYAGKLFGAFQRLHSPEEFEGTGIGLATVQRVIRRHGGDVWAEGEVGRGATFYFTLTGGVRTEPVPKQESREDPRQPKAPA